MSTTRTYICSRQDKLDADLTQLKKQHAKCGSTATVQVNLLQEQIAKLEEEVEYQKNNVKIELFNKEQVRAHVTPILFSPPLLYTLPFLPLPLSLPSPVLTHRFSLTRAA